MKRLLIALTALTLAGCGAAPEDLVGKTSQIKQVATVGCEGLDDAFVAAFIDLAADLTGNANGVDAIRARRKLLCATAGDPVPAGELTPIPAEKPAEG